MSTLLKKIFIFFLVSFSAFFLLKFSLRNFQQKNYNSAFVDKLKILKANKLNRKIILFGGSSVGWGFSAELIEHKLGIKTINLGHSMGFGLTEIQPFLMQNLTRDDIIVFSPEWKFYTEPEYYDTSTLENLYRYNYEYGRLIGNVNYEIKSYFSKIQLGIGQLESKNFAYIYNCLNKNGDVISQCNLKGPGPRYYGVDNKPLKLDAFPQYFPFLRTHKVIFAFPPTQERIYMDFGKRLNFIQKSVLDHHYLIVDSVSDNVYPQTAFFDAEYHITCDVRTRRTEKLISYLQQFIK